MADLIDTSRAILNAKLAAINTSSPSALAALITAASQEIERYCSRTFGSTTYTEYLSGGPQPYDVIVLQNFPVTAITRVATNPAIVLYVANTDGTTNQRATVATTATGLALIRVASGVSTASSLTYSGNVTITALAAAINALGNGWSANVASGYGLYPSADLKSLQGATSAIASTGSTSRVGLEMYMEQVNQWTNSTAIFDGYDVGYGPGWRLDDTGGMLIGRWPQGSLNLRIDYTAGFATIPAPVQQACVQLCVDMYDAGNINSSIASERLGPQAITIPTNGAKLLTPATKSLLAGYDDSAAKSSMPLRY